MIQQPLVDVGVHRLRDKTCIRAFEVTAREFMIRFPRGKSDIWLRCSFAAKGTRAKPLCIEVP